MCLGRYIEPNWVQNKTQRSCVNSNNEAEWKEWQRGCILHKVVTEGFSDKSHLGRNLGIGDEPVCVFAGGNDPVKTECLTMEWGEGTAIGAMSLTRPRWEVSLSCECKWFLYHEGRACACFCWTLIGVGVGVYESSLLIASIFSVQ